MRSTNSSIVVNDVHSRLNPTRVSGVRTPSSVAEVESALAAARHTGVPLCIAGGRHAMGGQQYAAGATLLDTRRLCRVLGFDRERGLIEVEAGIQWLQLVDYLARAQAGTPATEPEWTIAQKQTGADDLSLGGAVSANCHGRGLAMRPLVGDVESLRVVLPDGVPNGLPDERGAGPVTCSRTVRPELFRLVVGGYGLFGIIVSVTLRLVPRTKLERVVELATADRAVDTLHERAAAGSTYGDFQFSVDHSSPDFLRRGVLSCYRPVDPERPVPVGQHTLTGAAWERLLLLAHVDKDRAFRDYSAHYLATSGQLYWSDEAQLGRYVDGYHATVDTHLGHLGSEMITELYVPRARLAELLDAAARELRRLGADLVYGTVRLIRRDEESFLAWARQDYACVVLNLHVEHAPEAIAHARAAFRSLIDLARERDGSYYLTYHRWATREQLLACYPQFPEFLRRKRSLDPGNVLTSEWYRACAALVDG